MQTQIVCLVFFFKNVLCVQKKEKGSRRSLQPRPGLDDRDLDHLDRMINPKMSSPPTVISEKRKISKPQSDVVGRRVSFLQVCACKF